MSTKKNLRRFAASGIWLAVAGAGLHAQLANAHGYTSEPPSRAYACQLGLNTGCGQPISEPQSVGEAEKGFPQFGPMDGKIASGGARADFALLDEQSAARWHLTPILDREINFDWYYTTGHKTTKWEYFITNSGWNPNAPLARESFESRPFCTVNGHGKPATGGEHEGSGPAPEKHKCTLPADRTGHHVILGLWTIDDTSAAFHNVIDVDIQAEGGPAPEWPMVGAIKPHRDLEVGDKVKIRAFANGSESEQFSTSIAIEHAEEGIAFNWAYKLASRINETQALVRAGKPNAEGDFEPVHGSNTLYAKSESGITSFELDIDAANPEPGYLHLHDLKPEYQLKDGKTTLDFTVMSNKNLQVSARLFDADNKQVGYVRQLVEGTGKLVLEASSVEGPHTLKVVGVDKTQRVLLQEQRDVALKAAAEGYDFEFPQSIASYKEGTFVLQPKTGEIFECKPFPFEGWCKTYSENANHYEPGVGSNWQDAWIKR